MNNSIRPNSITAHLDLALLRQLNLDEKSTYSELTQQRQKQRDLVKENALMKQQIDLQRQSLNDCLEKEAQTKNQYENIIKAFQDKN